MCDSLCAIKNKVRKTFVRAEWAYAQVDMYLKRMKAADGLYPSQDLDPALLKKLDEIYTMGYNDGLNGFMDLDDAAEGSEVDGEVDDEQDNY